MKAPSVLVLGPDRRVISGVATHLNLLFGSALARRFNLVHFQVGSEGRKEGRVGMLARLIASPFRLAAAIARADAEIVHVNTSLNRRAYWRDLMYVLAAKLGGARVVYQVHGGAVRALQGPNRLVSALMRRVLRVTLQWPDAVVVLSRCELEDISQLVPRQNVILLPNAIDCRPFLEQRRPPSDPHAPLRLVYIGRLVGTKGLFEIVQGLALARRLGVAAQLVVAGDGPDGARLRQAVHDLGIAEHVSFARPAFGERKAKLLGEAEVFVLPSYHEGLPYALLEGMATGLVPIVTRVGAIPDVVVEGVHGVFVPSRDPESIAQAIVALAADRARLARMSVACRERVASSYSIERLAAGFGALYAGLWGAASPKTAL
jgi:glycosyltransferase involved in cell wall biosynthesis